MISKASRESYEGNEVPNSDMSPKLQAVFSPERNAVDDATFITRIASAYRYACFRFEGHGESMWADINACSSDIHSLLMKNDVDVLSKQLRHPHTTELLFGFEDMTGTKYAGHKSRDQAYREGYARSVHLMLIKLAEAVGAIRASDPESLTLVNNRDVSLDNLIGALDEKFGFQVDFPNPYPNEFGLQTSRGIIQHRTLHAVYQAWRLTTFANQGRTTRVLEIGAGLGRTAYFSRKFGLTDYTIIDIPLSSVAQADFLGRLVDPLHLVLSNECYDSESADKIRIFDPQWLTESPETFDVILNADSITEIDCGRAVDYFRTIAKKTDFFISINHEMNPYKASDLPALAGTPAHVSRYPYWLREGYVEEVFCFKGRAYAEPDLKAELYRSANMILKQQIQLNRQAQILDSRRALVRRLLGITRKRSRLGLGWP